MSLCLVYDWRIDNMYLCRDAGSAGDIGVPRTSSTPHKDSAQDKGPSHSKWLVKQQFEYYEF